MLDPKSQAPPPLSLFIYIQSSQSGFHFVPATYILTMRHSIGLDDFTCFVDLPDINDVFHRIGFHPSITPIFSFLLLVCFNADHRKTFFRWKRMVDPSLMNNVTISIYRLIYYLLHANESDLSITKSSELDGKYCTAAQEKCQSAEDPLFHWESLDVHACHNHPSSSQLISNSFSQTDCCADKP